MSTVSIEDLAGTVFGLQVVILALVKCNKDHAELLQHLDACGAALQATMATMNTSAMTRDATREVLAGVRRQLSKTE